MKNVFPIHLTDRALVAELMRLARGERDTMLQMVTHLAELDRRKLFRPAGYSSLYVYCLKVMQLSEDAAYSRVLAARTVRRYPEILGFLADGSLNLTTLKLIAKRLTPENHRELIQGALRKRKREVLELLARLFPQPDVAPSVRALPNSAPPARPPAPAAAPPFEPPTRTPAAGPNAAPPASALLPPAQPPAPARPAAPAVYRPPVTPLAPDRYQVTFTASADTRDKLEFARDLLRHSIPSGDIAAIMDRALTVLIEDLVRKKFAVTKKPKPGHVAARDTSYIPAAVRRAVYIRDCGRCTFVGRSGVRCNERAFVEFEHIVPRAKGGRATVENTCLLCRSHNAYTAELHFGPRNHEDLVREPSPGYGTELLTTPVPEQVAHRTLTPTPREQSQMGWETMGLASLTRSSPQNELGAPAQPLNR